MAGSIIPRSKNVDSWISEHDPSIRRICHTLRDLILATEPDLRESIKWSNPVYEKRGRVAYLSATDIYVALGFFNGAGLYDPEGKIEGMGKMMRHVKVRALEDIGETAGEYPAKRRGLLTSGGPFRVSGSGVLSGSNRSEVVSYQRLRHPRLRASAHRPRPSHQVRVQALTGLSEAWGTLAAHGSLSSSTRRHRQQL